MNPPIPPLMPAAAMSFFFSLSVLLALPSSVLAQDSTGVHHHHHAPADSTRSVADPHAGHATQKKSNGMPAKHHITPQPTIDPKDAEYEPFSHMAMGGGPFWMLLADQLEYRSRKDENFLQWDSEAWYGGDFNRIQFKAEGEQTVQGPGAGQMEFHGYYSRLVAPFWDALIGLRYDRAWGSGSAPSRLFGAIGVEGFAPYRFEVIPTLFISEDGDISARVTATQDYRITQRLIGQSRLEAELAAQQAARFGVGSGFNYVELGLRLRYEIRREFAPYLGVSWERKLGETADFSRQSGEAPNVLSFVGGFRIWF